MDFLESKRILLSYLQAPQRAFSSEIGKSEKKITYLQTASFFLLLPPLFAGLALGGIKLWEAGSKLLQHLSPKTPNSSPKIQKTHDLGTETLQTLNQKKEHFSTGESTSDILTTDISSEADEDSQSEDNLLNPTSATSLASHSSSSPIIPNTLTPVVPDTSTVKEEEFRDQLNRMKEQLAILAPNTAAAISCRINEKEYKIWYNGFFNAVNVQLADNYKSNDEQENSIEKIGYKITDSGITYSLNGQPCSVLSNEKKCLLTQIIPEIVNIKDEYDRLMELENKFDPDSLQLLIDYLSGPLGSQYRSAMTEVAPQALDFNNLKLWMRFEEQQENRWSRREIKNVINIQPKDQYEFRIHDGKIGISIKDGKIKSLFMNGEEATVENLFIPNTHCNITLTEAINSFLTTIALKNEDNKLKLHNLVLSRQPETVLEQLCNLDNKFQLPSAGVNFLASTLQDSPGIDAGGPKQQLISNLSYHLVDGAKVRKIKLSSANHLPALSDSASDEEKKTLKNLGKLLSFCFESDPNRPIITGRIFKDSYFAVMQLVIGLADDLTDEQIIQASEPLLTEEEDAWIFNAWNTGRLLTGEETSTLVDILCLEFEPNHYAENGYLNGAAIKDQLGKQLMDRYKNNVLAAHQISMGISNVSNWRHQFKTQTTKVLSEKIQGLAFDRETIINRIICRSINPIVHEKSEWLKEFIREKDQNWVEKLLMTITGQRTITSQTAIRIFDSSNVHCTAHTCFKNIDIPKQHTWVGSPDQGRGLTNKEKFLNNLNETLNQEGYDME